MSDGSSRRQDSGLLRCSRGSSSVNSISCALLRLKKHRQVITLAMILPIHLFRSMLLWFSLTTTVELLGESFLDS